MWVDGSYGLNQKHHRYRLCRKKGYNDLSNHMRQYHGLYQPIANIIARAVSSKIPVTKCLIPNDLQVTDPRRSFLCPFRSDCEYEYYLPTTSLRGHLIDIHNMNQSMAEIKVKKFKKLNKNRPLVKINNEIYEVIKKIESTQKDQCKHIVR